MKYKITLEETLYYIEEIEAATLQEATEKLIKKFKEDPKQFTSVGSSLSSWHHDKAGDVVDKYLIDCYKVPKKKGGTNKNAK